MVLFDEEEIKRKNEKNRKVKKLIITGIILTMVLIVALMITIFYLIYNPNKITVSLDGGQNTGLENMLITETGDDGSQKIYFPIRQVAKEFGYSSNNGEYTTNLEDKDSCNVESDNEVAIFKLDSNIIYKIAKNNGSSQNTNLDYEYVKIDTAIIKKDDVLYASAEGIEKAFNLKISYNEQSKKMTIYTLGYMLSSAKKQAESQNAKVDEEFANQKAVLDNMIVIDYENGLKGVIVLNTKKEVLGAQYDDIKYVPEKKVFLVQKNKKFGIADNSGLQKVKTQYDSLTLIDNDNDLYLAQNGNKYGVIDIDENTIIYLEYDQIGVDISQFEGNGLKSGYILLDKLIPVEQGGKWGFYSIESTKNSDGTKRVVGKQLTSLEFDGIGCIAKTRKSVVSNLMVMEDYGLIIVNKNNLYGFMNTEGRLLFGGLTDIYVETASGKTDYYMVAQDQTINIIQYFEQRGITKVK